MIGRKAGRSERTIGEGKVGWRENNDKSGGNRVERKHQVGGGNIRWGRTRSGK